MDPSKEQDRVASRAAKRKVEKENNKASKNLTSKRTQISSRKRPPFVRQRSKQTKEQPPQVPSFGDFLKEPQPGIEPSTRISRPEKVTPCTPCETAKPGRKQTTRNCLPARNKTTKQRTICLRRLVEERKREGGFKRKKEEKQQHLKGENGVTYAPLTHVSRVVAITHKREGHKNNFFLLFFQAGLENARQTRPRNPSLQPEWKSNKKIFELVF